MTPYDTIMVVLEVLELLISMSGPFIALLTYLDKRDTRKKK